MTEHEHQASLVKWWAIAHKRYRLPEYLLMGNPNGGLRHIAVAKKLKAEGARDGVPDLQLAVSANGYNSLWIELKSESGTLQTNQKRFIELLNDNGSLAVVCYGWTAAKDTIESYLKERLA